MDLAYGVYLTVMDVILQKWKQRGLPSPGEIGGDVRGQIIIVTGPTSGIGQRIATTLARRGAKVILACRSTSKGEALKEKLVHEARQEGREAPHLEVQELDVSSLLSIRNFCRRWTASARRLDCLINNAGILSIGERRALTVEGFETHMSTNFLGPYLLTVLLLPALKKAGTPENPSRIVMVSSIVHFCCRSLVPNNMNLERRFSVLRAYGQSKYAQVAIVAELRRRLPQDGSVAAFASHPGECSTDIVRTLIPALRWLYKLIIAPLLIATDRGSLSALFCATSNPVSANLRHMDPEQCYVGCGCKIESPAVGSTAPGSGAWLWEWCSKAVKLGRSADLQRT